ncbi:MAG TPA: alkene reductase [Rhodanobacteraceae bacterium]
MSFRQHISPLAYPHLLSPVRVGTLELPNRVFMAPLTRSRCPDLIPGPLQATYYSQRAGAGLIISEGTNISEGARGYALTPGIYTDAQEAGWQRVVASVHAAGGHIALQLWHCGRVSHERVHGDGRQPVAPSAVRAENARCFIALADGQVGFQAASVPRALDTDEIPQIVDEYREAARRAMRAGFDMVEIHAANAYLLQQFMATGSNRRTDAYGGSLENRARLTLEVVDAVAGVAGAARTGIRISPFVTVFGLHDDAPEAMAFHLAEQLDQRRIACLHVEEPDWAGDDIRLTQTFRAAIRQRFRRGALVFCSQYTAERAEALIADGIADAVAFGKAYLANPDLVERFRRGAPLNVPERATFYGGGAKGYTDYPTLQTPA